MRFLSLPLLAGAALANPFSDLEKRQLNPAQISSCSVSHTAQCTRTLLSTASSFCASLGYGTTVNTVTRNVNIQRTIATTITVTTGTTTATASPVTNTVSTVRTTQSTTTLTINSATTTTQFITEEATGTIEACPAYTAAQPHSTDAATYSARTSSSTTSASTTSSSTSATTTSRSSTTTSSSWTATTSAAPTCTWLTSPPSRFCGQAGRIGIDTRDTTITMLNTGYAIASLEGCALACSLNRGSSSNGRTGCQSVYFRQNSFCQLNVDNTNGTQWLNDASGTYSGADLSCFSCTGPGVQGVQDQRTSSTTTSFRSSTSTSNTIPPGFTPNGGGNTPSTTSTSSTTTSSGPALPRVTNGGFDTCPGSNTTILEYEGGNHMQVLCGLELTAYTNFTTSRIDTFEQCLATCIQVRGDDCRGVQFWSTPGFPPACDFLGANARGTFNFQPRAEVISAMRVRFYVNDPYPNPVAASSGPPMVRRVAEPLEIRQAAPIKPACLRATNAVQTRSACNCVIPRSIATLTSAVTNTITNMRTISTTRSILATVTQTPTITVTNTRTSTLTRTRSTTRWTTEATTSTSTTTVSWQLASTPAAFYIVDSDMAFAEWPADADEIYYHVQYDSDQTDDEYAPTVFSLTGSNGDELRVANIANETGPTEGWRVVGQTYDGPGWQMMALEDSGGYTVPACRIDVTADGKCPLRCNLGTNDVNGRNNDGLWSLLPHGTEDGFNNFAMVAADVEVEPGESPVPPPTSTRPSNATMPAISPPAATPSNCMIPTSRANPTNKCDYNYENGGFYNSRTMVYSGTTRDLSACLDWCDSMNAGPDTGCAMGDYECITRSCKLFIQGGSTGRPVTGGAITFLKQWNSCNGAARIP